MDVSLDGKVALVTGAGPNIGSGIALALARYGAKVACNDLDLEASEAAVRRISRNGGEGLALSGDVSVEADVARTAAAVRSRCRGAAAVVAPGGHVRRAREHPDGQPAIPTDIGHCIAWLSSDYARLITGCDFVVDGGARAKYWAYTPDAGAAAGAADSAGRLIGGC